MIRLALCFLLLATTARSEIVFIPMEDWTRDDYLMMLYRFTKSEIKKNQIVQRPYTGNPFADKRAYEDAIERISTGAQRKFGNIHLSDMVFTFSNVTTKLGGYDFENKEFMFCIPGIWFYTNFGVFEHYAGMLARGILCNSPFKDWNKKGGVGTGGVAYGRGGIGVRMPSDEMAERLFNKANGRDIQVSTWCKWTVFDEQKNIPIRCYMSDIIFSLDDKEIINMQWNGVDAFNILYFF